MAQQLEGRGCHQQGPDGGGAWKMFTQECGLGRCVYGKPCGRELGGDEQGGRRAPQDCCIDPDGGDEQRGTKWRETDRI